MVPASKLEEFRGRRVVVIGDLMVDEFVRGDVTRISPEAPVPVLEVKERSMMPGGAANAAANVASLGGEVVLVGVIGSDSAGETARRLASQAGIDARALVVDDSRPTTLKTRIVARNQQVVRLDHESRGPYEGAIAELLSRAALEAVATSDACIISDYGKGVVTPALVALIVEASAGKPIVVDPKRRDFAAYCGATVVTPNLSELEVAVGRPLTSTEDIVEAATSLLSVLGGGAVLVTRGAAGMSLVAPGQPTVHVPTRARSVFDVTGAGDTVVGTLALGLAVGLSKALAIELASAAAAIAVSKAGTATVTVRELQAELQGAT